MELCNLRHYLYSLDQGPKTYGDARTVTRLYTTFKEEVKKCPI